MDIKTYDNERQPKYDIDEISKYIDECHRFQETEKTIAVIKAESYLAGYKQGIYDFKRALELMNYRVIEPKTTEQFIDEFIADSKASEVSE
ncbi:MAG TPA: hypothetical protein VEF53_18660 [Patescibacteria group bacterium]|nr:hypothetical protein [Patescibacteria group bacterium]